MTPNSSHTNPVRVFHEFDAAAERALGSDMRMIYGMLIPILMVCGLIVLLALKPETWLVIAVLVLECAALGVVVTGFLGMLNEDEDDPTDLG